MDAAEIDRLLRDHAMRCALELGLRQGWPLTAKGEEVARRLNVAIPGPAGGHGGEVLPGPSGFKTRE